MATNRQRHYDDGSVFQRSWDGLWIARQDLGQGADGRRRRWLRRWLEDVARPTIRPSTWRDYETTVRRHLIPNLGSTRLTRLTPAEVVWQDTPVAEA
jgi:hypothetical protein